MNASWLSTIAFASGVHADITALILHRQVARMAQEANLPCTPHCANLSMVTLFTMHLLRAIPNAGKYLEFSIEGLDYYPWQDNLFTESPYAIVDGHATVTEQPGWGAEPAMAWLDGSHRQLSTL